MCTMNGLGLFAGMLYDARCNTCMACYPDWERIKPENSDALAKNRAGEIENVKRGQRSAESN